MPRILEVNTVTTYTERTDLAELHAFWAYRFINEIDWTEIPDCGNFWRRSGAAKQAVAHMKANGRFSEDNTPSKRIIILRDLFGQEHTVLTEDNPAVSFDWVGNPNEIFTVQD